MMQDATRETDFLFPISEERRKIYDYYKLVFAPDGCPMKQTENGQVFHPILATYLIADYTREFEKSGDPQYLAHAERIADLALQHAERLGEALVFLYHPDTGLSNVPTVFYSALTQARYLKTLCLVSKHRTHGYEDAIRRVFASLQVPASDGGVLIQKDFGWIVEEYPYQPAFYTLNGWLTVLRMVVVCQKTLRALGIDHEEFLERNLNAVEHMLPLYDAEFCLNSRYQLTGFSRIKIVFDRPVEHVCGGFEVEIPGEGTFQGNMNPGAKPSRWGYYLERSELRLLQFNVLLSAISKPTPNVFRAQLTVDRPCKAKIYLAKGSYRPDTSGMPTERWQEIAELPLEPEAAAGIDLPIPFDGEDLFAYPTNFKKKIGGILYNGYHFIHIVGLAELYVHSHRPLFKEYAERWLGYVNRWRELPALAEGKYSLKSPEYGDTLNGWVARVLGNKEDTEGAADVPA